MVETDYDKNTLEIIAVEKFLSMIAYSEDLGIGISTVTVSASEPQFAFELNAALIEELDAHQRQYNKTKTSETRQFIEERIVDTEKELQAAEEDLKDFRDRNRRIENSASLLLEQQRISREVAVLTSVFTTLKQQLETTKIEEVKDSEYVIVLDPPEVPIHRSNPKKRKSVILAGIIGLGLGIIISFMKEFIENSDRHNKYKMNKIKQLFIDAIISLNPRQWKRIH